MVKTLEKLEKPRAIPKHNLQNDIGIEISQISRIERGSINTSIGNIFLIANALKVPLEYLFSNLSLKATS